MEMLGVRSKRGQVQLFSKLMNGFILPSPAKCANLR